jgi:hypothetical protein
MQQIRVSSEWQARQQQPAGCKLQVQAAPVQFGRLVIMPFLIASLLHVNIT